MKEKTIEVKTVTGYKAYCPVRKKWFHWIHNIPSDLKERCKLEGLIKFQEI